MSTKWLPTVRVAACNVAPVFLDTQKTVLKTISLIQEAARNRADLVVFPETHLPGYPLWAALSAPIDNHHFFTTLASQALLLHGPSIKALREACRQNHIYAHIGFNERHPSSVGCLYNSSVLISDEGKILNHHRKIVPTFYEKLIWSPGDGSALKVVDTERLGKVGSLICGENSNPLARSALVAQGEMLHVTTWPPVWPTKRASQAVDTPARDQCPNLAANLLIARAASFEGKVFSVMCAGHMDSDMRSTLIKYCGPSAAETLDSLQQDASMFIDPTGSAVGDQVSAEEGIAYADLDLMQCVEPKQFHDFAGGYQRWDIFDLKVNRRRLGPENSFSKAETASEQEGAGDVEEDGEEPGAPGYSL
ncbi:carbon-nitrogen hydrolase [Polychaeton citri CBS 116435]|uniref:Carbon-nitrogen hydrolase n=1 Tax=Polychaeton citri CBS 116435 TaxID=1314669 RepID=A0A9P4UPZ5_9PEZI|nr:carbon-nitrogen hydrolase [Polychaeton citri CBS 116435]